MLCCFHPVRTSSLLGEFTDTLSNLLSNFNETKIMTVYKLVLLESVVHLQLLSPTSVPENYFSLIFQSDGLLAVLQPPKSLNYSFPCLLVLLFTNLSILVTPYIKIPFRILLWTNTNMSSF